MRKVFAYWIIFIVISFAVKSQAPQSINYQAVARDGSGNIVTSAVGIKFQIYQGTVSGSPVYEETHTATPSSAGIVTVKIGTGTPLIGTFTGIAWGSGPYFLQVSIDPSGGTSYSVVSASQLVAVPYALFAEKAGNVTNYTAGSGITIAGGVITNSAADQTVTISSAGIATLTNAYPNFTVNVGQPSLTYNTGTKELTLSQGGTVATATLTGSGTNTVAMYGAGIATVTPSGAGSNFTVGVPSPSFASAGPVSIVGSYPYYTVLSSTPAPISTTITGSGIAVVSPTVGNSFNLNVPPVGISYMPGTGILTYSPSPGINSINISPALSFSNMILSVGSNTVPIPGTGLWARPSATATILNNAGDFVGIGTNNPGAKLDISAASYNVLNLRTTAGNSNVNIDAFPTGSGNLQLRTGSPNGISFVTSNIDRMLIDPAGNVGIGTNIPAAPLEVAGKTITDSIQIGGSGSPTPGSVLVARDNLGNAKWSNPVMFKGTFAPAAVVNVGTAIISSIGGTAAYSSATSFNVGGGLTIGVGSMAFTAPASGYYSLSASVLVSVAPSGTGNAYLFLEIYNNSSLTVLGRDHINNSDASSFQYELLQVNTVAYVTQGQQLILRVGGSIANAGTITTNYSPNLTNQFSGFLIR